MILEAERLGCVREVIVIAAALSLQDPRERPGRAAGRRPTSSTPGSRTRARDFLTWLNLWRYLKEQQRELSQQRVPPDVQARVPQLPAGPRVAGLRVPAAPGLQGDEDRGRPARATRPTPTASTRRCSPGCSATSALLEERENREPSGGPAGVPRRPRRPVRDLPRQRAAPEEPAVPDGRRARRDLAGCGPGRTPRSSPSGPSGSARTWSSAPTPSRTGPRSARR